MIALWCPTFSNHGRLIMPETQQPIIIIILIIYSTYFLEVLVQYIVPRTAISSSYVKLQAAFFMLACGV